MGGYTPGGGRDFGRPDYSNAEDNGTDTQVGRQGNPVDDANYTRPNTFESGMPPEVRNPIESNWSALVNDNGLDANSKFAPGPVDGYRPEPVGGTWMPPNGSATASTERSATSGGGYKTA